MRARVSLALALASGLAATEARAACTGRPTDSGGVQGYSYGAAEVKSHATAQARVHWATTGSHAPALTSTRGDGVPDTVAFAAETADEALGRYAQMGYRKVPSDAGCASNGGDEKVDIYLVHFAAADGSTIAECNGATCSSFALVESTFSGKGYANAEEGFKTVITHEFFHAVQNTYKTGDDPFWAEGTAQWAMKTVHPELLDFERALPGFFKDTTRSIDAPPTGVTAGFLYGSAVWPLFLASKHGPEVIREIFEREAGGQTALAATNAVLETKGSSLADAYPLFGAWCAGTGKLAGTGGFADAAKYPGVALAALADGSANITSGLAYFAYTGALPAKRQVALEGDPTRNAGVVVPLEGGKPVFERAQKLPADAEGDVLVVVAGITTKKTDAPFTVRLLPPSPSPSAKPDGCSLAHSPTPASTTTSFALLCLAAVLTLRSRRLR